MLLSSPLLPAMVVAMILGCALALLVGRAWHRQRVRPLKRRIEQLTFAQQKTNEMLRQARQQAEVVQKALELARRSNKPVREPVLPTRDGLMLGLGDAPRFPAFADTMIDSRLGRAAS